MLSGAPRHGGERVWEVWVGCCTAEAAKPTRTVRRKARALGRGKNNRGRCTSPGAPSQSPVRPPIPPSPIDHVPIAGHRSSQQARKEQGSHRAAQRQRQRPMMPTPPLLHASFNVHSPGSRAIAHTSAHPCQLSRLARFVAL
ncbi:hypothetical protein EK21DRAFT_115894 [Setomelanomma holmii]|uniref:Uncharacterized protein n=1 Tax=Setomelanomma holmii TaxID=210430 RepID=A0A9P4H3A8_9PLEO|nr:hypothetical protein EK21DRAFT_115894 [Setomelanomma holmii]